MEFFIDYWYIFVALVACVVAAGVLVYRFFKIPSEEQLNNVREWLVGEVTKAEKELGSGTGQLKLRQVYDAFLVRFPWLARIITFNTFSELVDDALDIMREMLAKNMAVQAYVGVGVDVDVNVGGDVI